MVNEITAMEFCAGSSLKEQVHAPAHNNGPLSGLTAYTRHMSGEALGYLTLQGYSPFNFHDLLKATEAAFIEEQADEAAKNANPEQIAHLFEEPGFVRIPPIFEIIAEDTDRIQEIECVGGETTEQRGLESLKLFLGEVAVSSKYDGYHDSAQSIIEGLTYIGEKEYAEAVSGLAKYWISYLEGDARRQLCAVANVSEASGVIKSDAYLLENILKYLGEDQLKRYAGRLVNNTNSLTADPELVKIIVLDDWVISGASIEAACISTRHDLASKYEDMLEINVITASINKIKNGQSGVPVKAYYKAHEAYKSQYGVHISGNHSSVDYDFRDTLNGMWEGTRGQNLGIYPLLINIIRSYREMKLSFTELVDQLSLEARNERQAA